MRYLKVIACTIVCGATGSVNAHHSDAGYDRDSVVAFEGTISRYVFRNPHVTIFVETQGESGETVEWEIETGSTPIMSRSGWTSVLLGPGDTVMVRAHPERNGRKRAILNTLETVDGNLWSQIEGDIEARRVPPVYREYGRG